MIPYNQEDKCIGCGACMLICPFKCIKIQQNSQGFWYPRVDIKNCVNCGACDKVCVMQNENYKKYISVKISAYALQHKDKKVLRESTSGGAFTAIIQSFCNENSVVFGSTMNDHIKVYHTYVKDLKKIKIFRKSKYVESFMGTTYSDVKKFLEEGKRVLFSGTPCQVGGLKQFLNKNYKNLLTVDIVCHGVPTHLLLDKYKRYLEYKNCKKVKSLEFRSKVDSNWLNPKIRVEFMDGSVYQQKSYANDDEYMIAFCKFLCIRKSCEVCKFANTQRVSDITIGDFWGIEDSGIKNISYEDGISLMLINSNMGENLLEKIKKYTYLDKVNLEFAVGHNEQLMHPIGFNYQRDEFLGDLVHLDFEQVRKKYLKKRPIIINFVSNLLGRRAKYIIKKCLRMKITRY
ncbi:Coenzyme F420 hydrogenase/dehydrogenase, beta subunit C-terminal domain [Clostridium sp. HV4-5-A1G]|uniref:Coenzyme F420 hydrogenase/dehydrogenase, beta subunit C-terminal domain n=1 Tax=Clostridium sp. HV4-5-A1G TaxID=2004595 RepID=UPI001238B916|nr:Coenzyme F420 hydrogenase/dehydrogenase, beta subunit C-terminal domain [Clostridium sp. HV4-5-A1G]KAA8665388.1 4Fe-4S dicluster domain-containing protein [Clostridium sp. HV4-5-A1G]